MNFINFLNLLLISLETNLAACSSGPCKNNGFCFDASSESHKRHLANADDYECFCPNGFSGKNCECKFLICTTKLNVLVIFAVKSLIHFNYQYAQRMLS